MLARNVVNVELAVPYLVIWYDPRTHAHEVGALAQFDDDPLIVSEFVREVSVDLSRKSFRKRKQYKFADKESLLCKL